MVRDIPWLLTILLYELACKSGAVLGRPSHKIEVKELKFCGKQFK